jgi:hypothetical protein
MPIAIVHLQDGEWSTGKSSSLQLSLSGVVRKKKAPGGCQGLLEEDYCCLCLNDLRSDEEDQFLDAGAYRAALEQVTKHRNVAQ